VRPEIVRILKADFGWMVISFYRCGATEAQHVGPYIINATTRSVLMVCYIEPHYRFCDQLTLQTLSGPSRLRVGRTNQNSSALEHLMNDRPSAPQSPQPRPRVNVWLLATCVTLVLAGPLTLLILALIRPRDLLGVVVLSLLPGALAGWGGYKIALYDRLPWAGWWILGSALATAFVILLFVLGPLR
jgi:hypothetical protein